MFKNSIYQILGSIGYSVVNLFIVVFTARVLGATGRGEITYLLAFSGLIQILTALVGNSVMVYILTKNKKSEVLLASFLWSVIISLLTAVFLIAFTNQTYSFIGYLSGIVLLQTCFINLLTLYTAQFKFLKITILRVSQPIIVCSLIFFFYYTSHISVSLYWQLLIVSYVPHFFVYLFEVFKDIKTVRFKDLIRNPNEFFKLGSLNQFNNLLQYGAYRYAIWIISAQLGIKEVGIFGMWLTLCDALWLIPNALANVNLAYASKPNYKLATLNNFLLITLSLVILMVLTILLIPNVWYVTILGKDFSELKNLIFIASPALVGYTVTILFAYYFSGKGLMKYNTLGSGVGFLTILLFSNYFTSQYGLKGAVLANSISYLITTFTMLFLFFRYKKELKLPATPNSSS